MGDLVARSVVEIDCFYCFIFFYFIFRFVVAGDAMLDAAMESSSGSYEYDQHLNINKTMVNTLSFALLPC